MAHYKDLTAATSRNSIQCLLCQKSIQNIDYEADSHLHSSQHKENHLKMLMSLNSIQMNRTEMNCQLCSQAVKIADFFHHIENPHHSENISSLKEMIEKDGQFMQIPDKSGYINCCICDIEINFTLPSVKRHITESKQHWVGKAMLYQPMNGIFSVEGHNEYLWCKICQIFFDNYIELIFQHVEESEHAKTMRKIKRLIKGQDITIDRYLQNLKEDKAFCKKCCIEVPCNVDNLQRHINGKKHPK